MAVRIVSLMARIGLDGTGFQQGLRNLQGETTRFAQSLKGQLAGAFGVSALANELRQMTQMVGRIKDMSEQFSVTTDEVQRLDAAAKMSGQSFEDVGVAMERLGAARKRAAEGDDELREMFERFGVSLADLNNPAARNIDLLSQMASAIKKMNLTAADSQALRELFGKSGARLAAIFSDIDNVKFTPIAPDDIKAIDEATKALERFRTEIHSVLAIAVGQGVGGGKATLSDKLKSALEFWSSPGMSIGKTAGRRLDEWLNPATASNPRARSAEPVGPEVPGAEPLFKDKTKTKTDSTLPLELQAALKTIMAAKATMEVNAQQQGKSNLLQGISVGGIGSRGAYTGMSLERAIALRGGDSESKQTAENTKQAAAILRSIDSEIKKRSQEGGNPLDF